MSGGKYASSTTVSSAASRDEIERTLRRYGASAFGYGWDDQTGDATVMFRIAQRKVRFTVPMPKRNDFLHTEVKRLRRSDAAVDEAFEQGIRQRWRALALVIKAKLEAVDAGISTVENEFLANIELPDGSTVAQWVQPQIEHVYQTGQMPALTAGGSRG